MFFSEIGMVVEDHRARTLYSIPVLLWIRVICGRLAMPESLFIVKINDQ